MSTETLFELLAHFDAINASELPDIQIPHTSVVTDPAARSSISAKTRSHRTKKTHTPYSTDLQRRRKAERDALRSEVQQLLGKLHAENDVAGRPGCNTGDNQTENLVKWRSQAMANCEDRIRSERVNQELKDVLAQQLKLFGSLRKVLRRTDMARDMEVVSQPQPTADRPFFQIDYSGQILAELAHNVAQMYTKMDISASAWFDEECSVTFRCQSNPDDIDGERCFNVMSRTPLVCAVTEARGMLWGYVTDKENPDTRKAFNFTRARSPAGAETQSDHRNCITALFIQAGPKGSLSFVNALGTYRKFEQAGRVFLVGGMRWILPAEGLQFEDSYSTFIEPSSPGLEHRSVVRTFYQLRSRNIEMAHNNTPKATKDKVMNSIANISRSYLQSMQNAFLDRSSPLTTAPFI